LPKHPIDGKDIYKLMTGDSTARSPHEHFACYYDNALIAVRDRQFKLVFPHPYRSLDQQKGREDGKPIAYRQKQAELALYDLKADIGETTNQAEKFPQVVARLDAVARAYRAELGDVLTKTKGTAVRPAGRIE
jgi:hypothetical protein